MYISLLACKEQLLNRYLNLSFIVLALLVLSSCSPSVSNKITAQGHTIKKLELGAACYSKGCDNLNFINLNRKKFKPQTEIPAAWIKHNDEAYNNFSKCIELIPDCANAYWKRGRCSQNRWLWYGDPKDNQASIADYKVAIQLAPASTEAHLGLWRAYLNGGKRELAKVQLETIVKLDPDWQRLKDLERRLQKYESQ